MCLGFRVSKRRHFEKHNLNALVNMDDLADGLPSIVPENKTTTLTLPYNINFIVVKNGEKNVLGSWSNSIALNRSSY
jgi:hypothetical protein